MDRTLSTLELCLIYKVQYSVIEKWRANGLPFVKKGNLYYYDRDEVIKWMSNRRSGQQQPIRKRRKMLEICKD